MDIYMYRNILLMPVASSMPFIATRGAGPYLSNVSFGGFRWQYAQKGGHLMSTCELQGCYPYVLQRIYGIYFSSLPKPMIACLPAPHTLLSRQIQHLPSSLWRLV